MLCPPFLYDRTENMTDFFHLSLDRQEINAISNLGLAHLGDALYELMVRGWLCTMGHGKSWDLHKLTVSYVAAPAQAAAAEKLMPYLSVEEREIYKRGRNTRVNGVPHGARPGEYHSATGLETLFGSLYLSGETDRLNSLFSIIIGDVE